VYVRHTPEQQVCILNTTYKRQISADRIEFELFPRPCGLVVECQMKLATVVHNADSVSIPPIDPIH